MLTIRLTRKGKKNQPFFKVVVVDKRRSSKGGRAVEEVGFVNPLTKQKSFKKERILQWIKNGAQPSASVHNLLVAENIVDAPKIKKFSVTKKAKAEIAKTIAQAQAPAPQSPADATQTNAEIKTETPAEAPKPTEEPKREESKPEEKTAENPSAETKSE